MINIEVSIVIVTMNHLAKLKNLLKSIFIAAIPKVSFEVILVDNCSSDGTVNYVSENYPEIHIISNTKIHGFATNNNKGARHANGKYIFICNPDIIITPNSVDILITYLQQNKAVGIACPQLLNSDLSFQHSVRNFMSLRTLYYRFITRGSDDSNIPEIRKYLLKDFQKNDIQKVNWAIGAALILPKEVYLNLKGFDENFFLYIEDVDLCLRCWKIGKQVMYLPNAVMIHDHQRASSKKINKLTWYHFKSLVYFFVKHNVFTRTYDFVK